MKWGRDRMKLLNFPRVNVNNVFFGTHRKAEHLLCWALRFVCALRDDKKHSVSTIPLRKVCSLSVFRRAEMINVLSPTWTFLLLSCLKFSGKRKLAPRRKDYLLISRKLLHSLFVDVVKEVCESLVKCSRRTKLVHVESKNKVKRWTISRLTHE